MLQSYDSAKPYIRWWWFNAPIRPKDVRYQLDWLKQNGFGGVEIAFMYALPEPPNPGRRSRPAGTTPEPREPGPEWLSPEWSAAVADAKQYAESIGLGCDFTFCSAWPFGGSIVDEADASRTFGDGIQGFRLDSSIPRFLDSSLPLSRQRLEKSWETARDKPLYILNHLDRHALERYAEKMGAALKDALAGATSRLFAIPSRLTPKPSGAADLTRHFLAGSAMTFVRS